MSASVILPDLATQVVVPVAAAVGIAFALLQWFLVSQVKVTGEAGSAGKGGASEALIEEEEGLNDHNVVLKCAEIQTAISEGEQHHGSLFLALAGCLVTVSF
jgi:inorganic pyrophosphatase